MRQKKQAQKPKAAASQGMQWRNPAPVLSALPPADIKPLAPLGGSARPGATSQGWQPTQEILVGADRGLRAYQ